MYEWDESKRSLARAKHGVDFSDAYDFEWETARTTLDHRRDYGEERFVTFGYISGRLHALAWTPRGEKIRIVMLRKANARERKLYEQT